MESLKESLVRNSFWSFLSSVFNRVGALIFTIVLTKFLLPEGYGIYSIVLSVAMIFYTFTELGTNTAISRYIAYALAKGKKETSAYYHYLLKIKLLLAITASIALFLLAYPLSYYLFKNSALFLPILVSSFYIFIMAVETFYLNIFYSLEKSEYTTLRYSLDQVLRITLSILIFYFIAISYRIVGLFVMFALITLFLLFLNLFYLKKLLPEMFRKSDIEIDKKRILKFVSSLTIASISNAFFSNIDAVILGIFLLPQFVGYFRVSYSLVLGITGILGFPWMILLTFFTKLDKPRRSSVLTQALRLMAIISIPAIFGLIILGRYLIRLLFGYAFLDATLSLYFLAPLIFPSAFIAILSPLLLAEEKSKMFAKLIVVTSVLNLLLILLFAKLFLVISPLWATAGVAIATTTSWFFYLFSFVYISKNHLGVKISFKPVIKPLISSCIMSFFLLFSLALIKNVTLLLGIFEFLLGVFVYLVSMILLKGITTKDLNLLKMVFGHKKLTNLDPDDIHQKI
ncbi:hypothetical protein A3K73_01610 [Candidatus Pacearchaeota archaeon RBG_13_36_9]|nr:MAG: hypothetical protein A3K73_01610 [Candidatus Pacearchaeota archaeon RBG_13_36_9]